MSKFLIWAFLIAWTAMGCTYHVQQLKDDQVYFYLKDTNALKAYFACSLDGFQPHPMKRHTETTWVVSRPADREFTYFYIVGNTSFVPDCRYKEADEFGSENCIYVPEM